MLRYLENVASLKLDVDKCTGCGMCLQVCPHAVFALENRFARIVDLNACMECGACSLNCPEGALSVRSGVGCAQGIINGAIRGTEPSCDCGGDSSCC
jgi:NAD-dependent dihydropyrimidine dehydrogenase PreA subunit